MRNELAAITARGGLSGGDEQGTIQSFSNSSTNALLWYSNSNSHPKVNEDLGNS